MNNNGIMEILEFLIVSIVSIGIVSQVIVPVWNGVIVPSSTQEFQTNMGLALTFFFGIPTFVGLYVVSSKLKDYYRSKNQLWSKLVELNSLITLYIIISNWRG